MASNGTPTTYLKLNQWVLSDKPGMDDFNEDNKKLDAALYDVQEAMSGKVNKNNRVEWFDLQLINGFAGQTTPKYTKDETGMVIVVGTIIREETPKGGEIFATLPEGYRPPFSVPFVLTMFHGETTESWSSYGWVLAEGGIRFTSVPKEAVYKNGGAIALSIMFKAAQ